MNVSIDNFAETIIGELQAYKNVTDENLEKAVKETAKDAVSSLKGSIPSGAGKYKPWSEYISGWKSKKVNGKGFHYVIYNSKKPGLAHLLEKGHAMKNGGRTHAFVHIKPVEERAIQEFEQRIKESLE